MSRSIIKLLHECKIMSPAKRPLKLSGSIQMKPFSIQPSSYSCKPVLNNCMAKNLHTNSANNYLVPIVVEQTGRGERSYDIYSRLLKGMTSCKIWSKY